MRKFLKKLNPFRYIHNGVRGAISLFMAVLLIPFLSIAFALIDVGKYNSAISILDEAMGVSSNSTLADYDSYLKNRWGVLCVSQDMDVKKVYNNYLSQNVSVLGNGLTLNSVNAKGEYSLRDPNVLSEQIKEFCKLYAPTELATKFLDLDGILSCFESLKNFEGILNIFNKSINSIDNMVTQRKKVEELKKITEDLDSLKGKVRNKYNAFESDVNKLIDTLKKVADLESQRDTSNNKIETYNNDITQLNTEIEELNSQIEELNNQTSDSDSDSDVDLESLKTQLKEKQDKLKEKQDNLKDEKKNNEQLNNKIAEFDIEGLKSNAQTSKDNYSSLLGDISTKMGEYKTKIVECQTANTAVEKSFVDVGVATVKVCKQNDESRKKDIDKKIKDYENTEHYTDDENYQSDLDKYNENVRQKKNLESDIANEQFTINAVEAGNKALEDMSKSWNKKMQNYNQTSFDRKIQAFNTLKTKVDNLNIYGITKDTTKIEDSEYCNITVDSYINVLDIKEYLDSQDKAAQTGNLSDFINGISTFFNSIFKMKTFYDSTLTANIDVDYYKNNVGGLPSSDKTHLLSDIPSSQDSAMAVFESISNFTKKIDELKQAFSEWWKFISLWEKVKELIKAGKDILVSLFNFAKTILNNILEIVKQRVYVNTYVTYNLSCRTDKSGTGVSFKSMSGGSADLPRNSDVAENLPVIGDIAVLINEIKALVSGGTDKCFYGAELEYVIFGSKSEMVNQLGTFMCVYLFRLIMDIIPVISDGEIQTIAAASTLAYPLVMAIIIFAEPFADTMLLVNGGEVPIWKTDVFLSPSGLPGLIESLVSICKFTTEQKDEMKESFKNTFKAGGDNYDYQKKLRDWQTKKTNDPTPTTKDNALKKYGKGLLKIDYRQHCFLLMLLFVGQETQIKRVSDLIQMEGSYKRGKDDKTFDLRKSYTFIDANANVSVQQFLPSILNESLFTINRRCFRGY